MILNMVIISEDLGGACKRSYLKSSFKDREITHVEVFNPLCEIASDTVYISYADDLPDYPGDKKLSLISIGEPHVSYTENPLCDCIIVDETISSIELLSSVQKVFQYYDTWVSNLRSIIDNEGSVDDLLRASLQVFNGNIMLHDKDFRVISYMTFGENQQLNSFLHVRMGESFSKNQLELVSKTIHHSFGNADPFSIKDPHFSDWLDKPRDLSYNIFLQNDYVLRLNIGSSDSERGLQDKHYSLISELGYYIKLLYMLHPIHTVGDKHTALTNSLRKILEGQSVSKKELEDASKNRQWDHWNDEYLCLVLLSLDSANLRINLAPEPLISVHNRVMNITSEMHPMSLEDQVVFIVNSTKASMDNAELLTSLAKASRENNLLIGVSSSFVGLRHLRTYYSQANTALELAYQRKLFAKRVYKLEDLLSDYIFETITETLDPISMIPEGLLKVIHHDNLHSSSLFDTLQAYLKCNYSPVKAANMLYVSRSTFYYRLTNAMNLLNMDLDDPETKFLLLFSFGVIQRMKKSEVATI